MQISVSDLDRTLQRFGHTRVSQVHELVRARGDSDLSLSLMLAVISRETNFVNEAGDGGHGRGYCQIDDRSWADWLKKHAGCKSGTDLPVYGHTALDAGYVPTLTAGVTVAMDILHSALIAARSYRVPEGERLLFACAAYNAGVGGAHAGFSQHGNPDHSTTGGNYGHDVLDRMHAIHQLLTKHHWL